MDATNYSISDKALMGTPGVVENLHSLSEHGFSHIHFSYQWTSREFMDEKALENFREQLTAANLKVLDVHGPHPKALDFGSHDPEQRAFAFEIFRHRLKVTHILGGDAMVYHVPTRDVSEGFAERYIDGLERVEDEARKLGIVIALENHYQQEVDRIILAQCFEKFDSAYIGFTFDPGHANISGNLQWILSHCMERLTVLHLNDNEGIGDRHWNPYQAEGTIDWDAVTEGIARSPYRKPLQLEVAWHNDKHAHLHDFLSDAFKSINRLHKKIEAHRSKSVG